MVESFYEKEVEIPESKELDYKWTPAEVNQILFRHFDNPEEAVRELVSQNQSILYTFKENESNFHEE